MKNRYFVKVLAIISALVLVCISAIPAFAASSVKVKVEIAGSEGFLYVRLTAPAGSNLSTFSAPLNFDASKLEFEEVSYLEDASIVNSTNEAEADAGLVIANTVIAESLTEETKIFTYVFKILDGADGDVTFSFGDITASNSDNAPLTVLIDGSLTASLSTLEPLTPDKLQSSFETTTAPSETSETTEPGSESQNQEANNIPNTNTKKIASISAVGVIAVVGISGAAVIIKKKKDEE